MGSSVDFIWSRKESAHLSVGQQKLLELKTKRKKGEKPNRTFSISRIISNVMPYV